ncbi:MAG: response regulator [Sandaracinaceae bacterium]|nr:response regulator [Sandaracinaceae bacterium]
MLIVEDSAIQRGRVEAALRGSGHRVTTAEHGLEALGKAIKDTPDVVLTDVNMPVMDGWQLLRLLRAREATRNVPVVFLTTLGSEQDRIRGYEAGVDDYMAKPFAGEELVARLRRGGARARRGRPRELLGADRRSPAGLRDRLLAFAEAERRSGILTLRRPEGEARVGLQRGAVISVDLPGPAPRELLERLLAVLDYQDGRFELSELELIAGEESVSVQAALLEHARRTDEAARGS